MVKWLAALVLVLSGCARLTANDIGLDERIVRGGQAEIDAGHVVDINQPGIWLAGHRTTNGSVFANLVFLRVGDRVCAYSTCWHVVDLMVVLQSYRPPPEGLAPLVLQTSWPGGRLLLVLCA